MKTFKLLAPLIAGVQAQIAYYDDPNNPGFPYCEDAPMGNALSF